jgi:modulator of FtsH protease
MVGWSSFFQSSAGASATLLGLVVVAISINLSRILEYPQLPRRAATALTPLGGVLVVSLLGLVPSQPPWLFGLEALIAGAAMWISSGAMSMRPSLRHPDIPLWRFWANLLMVQAQSLPFIVAGIMLMAGNPAGGDWIVPAVIFSIVAGLTNTWVLLIEILR